MKSLLSRLPKSFSTRYLLKTLFVILLISFLFFIDLKILDAPLIQDIHPIIEIEYGLRTAVIALVSVLIVLTLLNLTPSNFWSVTQESLNDIWKNWGFITWSIYDPNDKEIFSISLKELIIWMVLTINIIFLTIFLTNTGLYLKLGDEDGLVETLSAAIYFLNCFIFIYIILILNLQRPRPGYLFFVISFVFVAIFFVVGMEEVSWFQRILSLETPVLFGDNQQREMNLHNFRTDEIQIISILFLFTLLILIPFIRDMKILAIKNSALRFFVPSQYIIFTSAIAISYNYERWNLLLVQLSFFITLFILIFYALLYRRLERNILTILAIIFIFGLTQFVLIAFGDNVFQLVLMDMDIEEYKEFFFPLAYLIYSIEILHKVKRFDSDQIQT